MEARTTDASASAALHPRRELPDQPSMWVRRFAPLIAEGGNVLDVACGFGRHARFFAALGHHVDAVDRDAMALAGFAATPRVTVRQADLEDGSWPYANRRFAGVVVTRYVHRPLLPRLIDSLAAGGVLIYESFMVGQEKYRRPSNPAFLLRPGELFDAVYGELTVVAFEEGELAEPMPAVVQRICAVRA